MRLLPGWAYAAAGALAAALLAGGVQQLRVASLQTDLAELHAQVEADKALRATAALQAEIAIAEAEAAHAAATQELSDAYTQSQAERDAAARADLDRLDRLRRDAERRAATYRAMSQASAATCRDLADRHTALDRHLVEGVAVVGELRAAIDRRDAEVRLLRARVDADMALGAARP